MAETSTIAALTPDGLLTTTRTVRRRLDLTRPVPLALVEECLRIAQQAPSGSGRHVTHWIVVTDPGVRAAIAEVYRTAFRENQSANPPGRDPTATPDPAADRVRRVLDSATQLARDLHLVPVHVLACVRTRGPLPAGNQAGLWGSVLPSVWSYQLAARARGLGTAWTAAHLRHEEEVAALLGIPSDVHQAALIPTAYFVGDGFSPAVRPPLAVHHNRW